MPVTFGIRVVWAADGTGEMVDFIAHTLAHYTLNANGELVVEFEFSDASGM